MRKIIDAHLHLFKNEDGMAEEMAAKVGHHNSTSHLREAYEEFDMCHGIIMGNGSLDVNEHNYPEDLFHYCVGLDSSWTADNDAKSIQQMTDKLETHLKRESCCGIKLYPGYNKIPLSDKIYQPAYELAASYDKPVAVHMGLTSHSQAHLKYCHPLALDEVAADHEQTRFVMCHFGNPFFESAAAVMAKNQNVATDLSGILEGRVNLDEYFREQEGYIFLFKTWLAAIGDWDRIMYGTDWPIVNLGEYIEFVERLVPEKHWDKVFFENASRIYGLNLI